MNCNLYRNLDFYFFRGIDRSFPFHYENQIKFARLNIHCKFLCNKILLKNFFTNDALAIHGPLLQHLS